jgi:O-antigen ligase
MPARAIASNFNPDPRDASSNHDRAWEDKDIMATVNQSPLTQIIGTGFGKPMLQPFSLSDVTGIYPLEVYLPHNSILWVWMRLGTIGYFLLWIMIGTVLVQATRLLRRLRDPSLSGWALLVIVVVIQQVIFGYLDIGWTNYRNMIVVGMLFALISRLSKFEATSDVPALPGSELGSRRRVRIQVSPTLAVIDGRLRH